MMARRELNLGAFDRWRMELGKIVKLRWSCFSRMFKELNEQFRQFHYHVKIVLIRFTFHGDFDRFLIKFSFAYDTEMACILYLFIYLNYRLHLMLWIIEFIEIFHFLFGFPAAFRLVQNLASASC